MNLAEQLRRIGGFGPEAMRDIEHDLACALVVAPHNSRGTINWSRHFPWLRPRLSELQGDKCCWCGCAMQDGHPQDRPTLDHVIPLARDGQDTPDNLAVACFQCNQRHANKVPVYLPAMPWHSALLLREAA